MTKNEKDFTVFESLIVFVIACLLCLALLFSANQLGGMQ